MLQCIDRNTVTTKGSASQNSFLKKKEWLIKNKVLYFLVEWFWEMCEVSAKTWQMNRVTNLLKFVDYLDSTNWSTCTISWCWICKNHCNSRTSYIGILNQMQRYTGSLMVSITELNQQIKSWLGQFVFTLHESNSERYKYISSLHPSSG